MKILTSNIGGKWVGDRPDILEEDESTSDPAIAEARRVLSDLFRCENLLVLAGLGTSLCVVNAQGDRQAPTMRDLWDKVRDKVSSYEIEVGADFNEILNLTGHPADRDDIEALLSRCRLAESFLQGPGKAKVSAFIELAEKVIVQATGFVSEGQDLVNHSEFLRRVARRSNRKARAKIFTTNYDLCFEEAARQGRYVVIDGFSSTVPATFDATHFSYDIVRRSRSGENHELISNVFHLYKLHGSINWCRNAAGEIVRDYKPEEHLSPLLIYPRSSKYELAFEQPYLEIINAFQTALREPNTGLLVVGFGFNDNHLSEPILSAIRSNLELKMAVVGPGLYGIDDEHPGESDTNKYLKKFKQLAEAGDARIALLNCGFEQLNTYVPDLVAESDLEQHYARMKGLERHD